VELARWLFPQGNGVVAATRQKAEIQRRVTQGAASPRQLPIHISAAGAMASVRLAGVPPASISAGKDVPLRFGRSELVLPMKPGQPERRTHDYYRHGTASLFAALDIATGKVIGK
jgi:hypothetical protein